MAFACMNTIVKYLIHFSAYQIVFFRSISTLIITISFIFKNQIPIFGNNKTLLVIRGLVGVTSMTFFFMSTKYLPIGTAVSLRYLAPIFAGVFAVVLLKEKIRPVQWLFFFIAFGGVVILKGFDPNINVFGLIFIIISALFSGLVYVVLTKIGKSEHPLVVVNYFMGISVLIGGILSINNWVNPVGIDWILLFLLGVFGYFGQVYMTKAFQSASSSSQIAPLKYLESIFTIIIGVIVFTEVYTFWALLGIGMIIIGLVLNAQFKSRKALQQK